MNRILIQLKNKTDLKILKEFLKNENFEIVVYDFEKPEYRDIDLDLIITDDYWAKRCMDKIKELRSRDKIFLPAICLIPKKTDSKPFLQEGFNDVIRYPISKSEFLVRVKNLLKIRSEIKKFVESEKRYRTLIESPIVAFWEADKDGNFTFVNKMLVKMAGYNSEDEIVGKLNMLDCIVPEQREWLSERIKMHKEHKLLADVVEAKLKKKNGSTFDVLVAPAPVYDEKGNLVKIVGAMVDISPRKRLEERLIKINKELDSYTSTVSHDLRAPLRAMQGFANALIEDCADKLDENGKFYIERIVKAAEHMDMLIKDLLEYSKLEKIDSKIKKLNVEKLLEEVFNNLTNEIKKMNAEITIEKPLPGVKADYNFLFQIFLNLISNAIKFVEEGKKPSVKIWAEEKEDKVKFWIEDNGIGIPAKYHEKIFNVFERLHGSERYSGTGIGLAIVKKCVEKLEGKFGLVSEPGKGSKFWFEVSKG